jgi:hypothetical protein
MTKSGWYLVLCSCALWTLLLSGCGGGGGTTPPGNGPVVDFSIAVQPTFISVNPGSSSSTTVSVGGSASSVNVSITGLPAGVTATPSTFTVASGAHQNVSFTAASTAAIASANITVSGTAGNVSHSAKASVAVNPAQKSSHPPLRTGYARTDVQWDSSFLNFAPQKWAIYHQPTRRFFVTDTFLNRVDVIDANTRSFIAQIPVPGAFVGDETPDHSAIYMGTQVGDIYKIDPVTMKVVQRFPAVSIGPNGFPTYELRVLADGRLALLGGQGGIPAVDGYSAVAIWNPVDNSFFVAPRLGLSPTCPLTDHILIFTLSADRSKILVGAGVSGGAVCQYDPVTDAQVTAVTNPLGIGVQAILTPAGSQKIIVPGLNAVAIYDANGLFQTDQFTLPTLGGNSFYYCSLSFDGNTLYAVPVNGGGSLLAFDWRTHQLLGWGPGMVMLDLGPGPHPEAVDETGLILASSAHGVSFLDGVALQPGLPASFVSNSILSPTSGPVAGGTDVFLNFNAIGNNVSQIFFGNQLAGNLASPTAGSGIAATSPPGAPGPVDVVALMSDGNIVYSPEGFSYGPSIVESITTSTTADGGATGTVFGYGFGGSSFGGTAAPGLLVTVNGQVAPVVKYTPQPLISTSISGFYLMPMEQLDFTLPPGISGLDADITISDAAGSTTAAKAVHYFPAVQKFPLPGSVLVQGVYDPRRDVYYFSDATVVQVFSRTRGWLAPIPMPAGATRLWGLSLSPDGTKLAVSDAGAAKIYVLNPDAPATISSFGSAAVIDAGEGGEPCGLAITDTGIVYYMVFYTSFTGPAGLHKLDTSTGAVKGFQLISAGALSADALTRVLLSSDNARLYINIAGELLQLDTATDATFSNPVIFGFDYELTLGVNQTAMSATGWIMDTNLNPQSFLTFTDRQGVTTQEVFGAKLSPDGALLFQPLLDSIDVFDARLGTLRTRLALPMQLSANYDALVSDGKDNVLLGISGQNGDGGVAVIDLTALPIPPPLPFNAITGSISANAAVAAPATSSRKALLPFTAEAARMRKPRAVTLPLSQRHSHLVNVPKAPARN